MMNSGEQSPSVQSSGGSSSPVFPTATKARPKEPRKGRTRAQGVHLLPLVAKWLRVAGILLAIWLVGYFRFSLTWVLVAELIYIIVGFYIKTTNKKKAVAAGKQPSLIEEQDEIVLARVEELPAWVYFPDTERAEWVNKVIQQMWPYIGEFVENTLRTTVEPIINKNLPQKLTPFVFRKINVGNIPPRVGGIKVYTDNVKRDEIIIDVDVTLAGDADLVVSIRGLSAGIKDIMVQGTVRVVMKPLLNKIPFIGGLSLFFISQPNIDFDLTNVAKVLDMPLLSTTLRTIICDQIANFLVLPNKIPIQLIENIAEAQFQYLLPQGVLLFTVIEATELKKGDVGVLGRGKSDPYCKLFAGGLTFQTDIIKNSITPFWNKSFEIIVDQCRNQVVNIEVMDKDDPGPDDDLGTAYVDIDELPNCGVMDRWLTLENVKTGQLHIKATWFHLSKIQADLTKAKAMKARSEIESTAILVVHIDSAKDLPSSKKYLKEPSPYVRLEVGNREEKTQVRRASTNPKWEENHQFLVSDPEIQELTVEVLDDGNHGRRLGIRKVHLKELLTCSEMAVTRPYTLKDASGTCSIVMSLILRILTPEKPASEDDVAEEEEDQPDVKPVAEQVKQLEKQMDSIPMKAKRGSDSTGPETASASVANKDAETASASVANKDTAEAEDGMSLSYAGHRSRSNSFASSNFDQSDGNVLRYRGQLQSDGRFGRINLTIRYSRQRQRLIVVIHQCVNLIPCDSENLADPYVRLYLLPDRSSAMKRKTQTHKNNLSPVFDETFDWQIGKAEAVSRTLEVMVKNSVGPFSRQRVNMGLLRLNLSDIDDPCRALTDWFDLQDPDASSDKKSSNLSLHR